MSKFYVSPISKEEGPMALWDNWHNDEPPKDGKFFMGRVTRSRSMAVRWDAKCDHFLSAENKIVIVIQWLTFAEYGGILSCLWKGPVS